VKHRVYNSSNLVYSVGTQVVALKQVQGTNGNAVHPVGAVGVIEARTIHPSRAATTSPRMRLWRIGVRKRANGSKVVVWAATYLNRVGAGYFYRSRNCYNKLILTNGLSGCTSGRN
jgi:hypothetical protein